MARNKNDDIKKAVLMPVKNGWIVEVDPQPAFMAEMVVFTDLGELTEWISINLDREEIDI